MNLLQSEKLQRLLTYPESVPWSNATKKKENVLEVSLAVAAVNPL